MLGSLSRYLQGFYTCQVVQDVFHPIHYHLQNTIFISYFASANHLFFQVIKIVYELGSTRSKCSFLIWHWDAQIPGCSKLHHRCHKNLKQNEGLKKVFGVAIHNPPPCLCWHNWLYFDWTPNDFGVFSRYKRALRNQSALVRVWVSTALAKITCHFHVELVILNIHCQIYGSFPPPKKKKTKQNRWNHLKPDQITREIDIPILFWLKRFM